MISGLKVSLNSVFGASNWYLKVIGLTCIGEMLQFLFISPKLPFHSSCNLFVHLQSCTASQQGKQPSKGNEQQINNSSGKKKNNVKSLQLILITIDPSLPKCSQSRVWVPQGKMKTIFIIY